MTKRRDYHPSLDRVRECFSYAPSGSLIAKISRGTLRVGDAIGTLTSNGYHRCKLDNDWWFVHNLVWFLLNEEWPQNDIDHIDGNRVNNRIENLRQCTRSQNKANSKMHRIAPKSGFKGVYWRTQGSGGWQARIMVNGKMLYCGIHPTAEGAHDAYLAGTRAHFGEFARSG